MPPKASPSSLQTLLSSPSTTQQQKIQSIITPVNTAVQSTKTSSTTSAKEVESALWDTWNEIFTAASQTPHASQDQDDLVQIVRKVQRQAGPSTEEGGSVKVWEEDVSWESMSLFGAALREKWNFSSETADAAATTEWTNLNAFIARLTNLYKPSEPFDLSLNGIWTIREALENHDPATDVAPDASIQAAAVWFIYASKVLYEKSQSGAVYDGKLAREGDSLKGKEWKGASVERWKVWGERLKVLEEKVESKETKELIGLALKKMKEVEG